MTYQAGSAQVSITPDFRDFHSQIAEELDTLDAQFAEAGDKSGKSFADSFQAQLKGSFADLPNATVKADADTTALDTELEEATRGRKATVTADADTKPADAQLRALTSKPWTVRVQAVADKVSGKTGTLADLANPVGLGALGGVALGPQAVGAALGIAGIGAGFAAAAADAGAFGVIAKGMFSDVTDAQKKLTTATDAYNKATTDKARAKALADEKAALAGLTPAEKDLATQLSGLKTAWSDLSKAEQPVVGGALTPWLQTATSGMKLLKPLIDDGAGAVQLLGSEAKTALADPFWGQFFNTLGVTGQIALTDFGNAAGHVGDGLAHLFVTFAPDIARVLPLVDKAATSFDHWASSVTSGGLENFFTKVFSPANLAELSKDGKSLESLVTNIAKASSDMGPLAFDGVSNVLTVLGSLPPGVIEAATGLFLAIKTAGTISKGISAVTGVIGTVKGLLGGAATTAETAAEGTTAGTAGGTAAATAFTGAFSTELNLALPTAFVSVGTSIATAADGAGTVWGTAAATTFGTAFATEDTLGLTAAFTELGTAGAVEANAAGAALGAAVAAGFGEGVAGAAVSLASALGLESGAIALAAAALAGGALGAAVGLGFMTGLGATGASDAVGKLSSSVQSGAAAANTWLQPAGQQAGQGFISGLNSQAAAAQAAAAALKNDVSSGTNGSQAWLPPAGQQTVKGFNDGFSSLHSEVNSTAAQLKTWITDTLPSNSLGAMLGPAGVSVVQGFANGIISATGLIKDAISYVTSLIPSTVSSLLGINSPAKVMIPLGSAVPEGVGVGMLGGAHFITSAGGQLADVTAQSLAGIAAGQSSAALSALGVPSIGASPRLPGVGSPLSGAPLQLELSWAGTSDQVTNALVSGLRVHIQGLNGGDVQGALGQGQVRTS